MKKEGKTKSIMRETMKQHFDKAFSKIAVLSSSTMDGFAVNVDSTETD